MSGPFDTPKTSAIDPLNAELATWPTKPGPRKGPVSWEYQFSWQESGLCLDGDPLDENLFSDSSSHSTLGSPRSSFVNQGSLGWSENPSSGRMDAAVVPSIDPVLSGIPVHSSGMGSKSAAGPQNTDLVSQAMQSCVASTVELLVDDYIKVHAPRGSKGRAAGASQKDTESASNSRTGESSGPNRGAKDKSTSRKRKAIGDDGGNEGESEDENSQDKKKRSSDPDKDKNSYRLACHYVKWKPELYTCKAAPKENKDVKAHLILVHYKEHCDKCLEIFPKGQEVVGHSCHPLDSGSIAPPGFITRSRRDEISKRESRSLSREDQWYRVYSVLFPGERRCYNPYANKSADEHLGRAECYFRSKRSQRILDQELRKGGFEGEIRKRVEMIHDGFLARMIQEYDPNDEDSFTPAQRVLQEDGTAQSSQVEGSGTETTPPKLVLEPAGEVSALNYAEFDASPDLNQADDILQLIEPETFNTYFGDLFEPSLNGGLDLWYDNFEMDGNQTGPMSGTS